MTSTPLTIKQLNNLGERLRKGKPNAQDLQDIDAFRRSFGTAYERVLSELQKHGFRPSGRGSKTTESIVSKLKREKTRLSKMQDIAGCRIVVDNSIEQSQAVSAITVAFSDCEVIDRRVKPSHGYRAVHIIAKVEGWHVEIQVRTSLQDTWAQLTEKLSDTDPEIKYGGGSTTIQHCLLQFSAIVEKFEQTEESLLKLQQQDMDQARRDALPALNRDVDDIKHNLRQIMGEFIISLRNDTDDFSN